MDQELEPSNFNKDIFDIINDKQQITYNELADIAFSRGIPKESLNKSLYFLEQSKAIAPITNAGILTYYVLQDPNVLRKVLIVEDDKNINKLMALSLGKGFEISQIYDGGEALQFIRENKPNLIILDLMLPNKNGLDICQTVKTDPDISDTKVILVSAMDPTSSRLKGIQNGADYYIKKPFDPAELRSLVTIFLKKKGKVFDPLIDLPNEERISAEVEHYIGEGEKYVMGTLHIDNFATYARRFGEKSAIVILRLISQLLQEIIKTKAPNVFIGFLNSDEFVIAGPNENVESTVAEVKKEFAAVLPFILQDEGYRQIDLDINNLFDSNQVPKLSLTYTAMEKEQLEERRKEILESKGMGNGEIGTYTYEELQKLFDREDLDVIITRDANGVKLRVGKSPEAG